MKSAWLRTAALACCLTLGTLPASACEFSGVPMGDSQLVSQDWSDVSDLSFRLGRDLDTAGRSTLIRRVQDFGSFAALVDAAADWRRDYTMLEATAEAIRDVGVPNAQTLLRTCEMLEKADLLGAPSDDRLWLEAMASRSELAVLARDLDASARDLARYADLLQAASEHYAARGFPANTHLKIGPPLPETAFALRRIALQVRAWASDMQSAVNKIPTQVGTDGFTAAGELEVAASTVDKLGREAQRLLRIAPAPAALDRIFLNGDHLYDGCPVPANEWITLENMWSRWNGGMLTELATKTFVLNAAQMPESLRALNLSALEIHKKQTVKFEKLKNGYFGIRLSGSNQFLDINYLASKNYFLTSSAGIGNFGQYWRCHAEGSGRFRLTNSFLGEEYSIDTYSDSPQLIMTKTGNFAAQYWTYRRP